MPSHRVTRCTTALIAWALLASAAVAQSQSEPPADPRIRLPTGQRITAAGSQVILNSMPMAIEVSRAGKQILVLQAGYETPSLSAIDIQNHALVSSVTLPDAWLGLTLNRAGDKAFVGGGRRGSVWEVSYRDGSLSIAREFEIPLGCAPECPSVIGDVRLDADDRMLYALDLVRDRVIVINTQIWLGARRLSHGGGTLSREAVAGPRAPDHQPLGRSVPWRVPPVRSQACRKDPRRRPSGRFRGRSRNRGCAQRRIGERERYRVSRQTLRGLHACR